MIHSLAVISLVMVQTVAGDVLAGEVIVEVVDVVKVESRASGTAEGEGVRTDDVSDAAEIALSFLFLLTGTFFLLGCNAGAVEGGTCSSLGVVEIH